jgi:hypothetical protein
MNGLAIMLQGQLGTRLKSLLLASHLAKLNNRVPLVFWGDCRAEYAEQTLALAQIWHPLGFISLPWLDAHEIRKSSREISNEALQDSAGLIDDDAEMVFLSANLSGSYLREAHYPELKACYEAHFIQWFRRRPLIARFIEDQFLPGRTVALHLGSHFFGESREVTSDGLRAARGVIDRIIAEDWHWRFFLMASNANLAVALAEYYDDGWADLRFRTKPYIGDDIAAEIALLVEACRAAPYFIGSALSDLSTFLSYSRGEVPETIEKLSPQYAKALGINPLTNARCGILDR